MVAATWGSAADAGGGHCHHQALLAGEDLNFEGRWFRAEHARLYSLPVIPPPIWLAAAGYRTAMVAGAKAQVHVCWAEDEAEARRTATRWWPHEALPGALTTELARPKDFQRASALVTEDAVAGTVVCGPDLDRHLEAIARYAGAGFTRVYVHQVGPDQAGFLRAYEHDILPRFPSG